MTDLSGRARSGQDPPQLSSRPLGPGRAGTRTSPHLYNLGRGGVH